MKDNFQCRSEQLDHLNRLKKIEHSRFLKGMGNAVVGTITTVLAALAVDGYSAIITGSYLIASLVIGLKANKRYKEIKDQIKELENQQEVKIR